MNHDSWVHEFATENARQPKNFPNSISYGGRISRCTRLTTKMKRQHAQHIVALSNSICTIFALLNSKVHDRHAKTDKNHILLFEMIPRLRCTQWIDNMQSVCTSLVRYFLRWTRICSLTANINFTCSRRHTIVVEINSLRRASQTYEFEVDMWNVQWQFECAANVWMESSLIVHVWHWPHDVDIVSVVFTSGLQFQQIPSHSNIASIYVHTQLYTYLTNANLVLSHSLCASAARN